MKSTSLTYFFRFFLMFAFLILLLPSFVFAQTSNPESGITNNESSLASVLSSLQSLVSSLQHLLSSAPHPTFNIPYSTNQLAQISGQGSGLIAHYTFDEGSGTTAVDSSGNGNTGTL